MIAPNVNANEKQPDLPATPTTQTVALASDTASQKQDLNQTLSKTSATTESFAIEQTASEQQMQRFEFAASLAAQKKQSSFSLDNQSYDTKFVQEFIQTLKKSGTEALKNEFMLDVLMQSAKTDKTGQCFGKTFSNATECAKQMFQICQYRNIYTISHQNEEQLKDFEKLPNPSKEQKEMMSFSMDLSNRLLSNLSLMSIQQDLTLDMPPEKQWHYFKNLNEEISSEVDIKTKVWLYEYAQKQKNPTDALSRLYKVMEASGNPAIRPLKDSPINWMLKHPRSNFVADKFGSSGTLYVSSTDYIPDELAHAFRNKNNTFGEDLQLIGDGLKDILTFKSLGFTESAHNKFYADKDKYEYDAHEIVEPTIEDYLAGNIETLEQMYALIDAARKKEGISYSQTDNAEEMTKKGHEQVKKRSAKKQILHKSRRTK